MYLVEIDISKFKHDCFIATETGEVIKNSFSFNSNYFGLNKLLSILNSLDKTKQIKIGLDATGHYDSNLKLFLFDNGYSFMKFNPILSERFRKVSTLRKTKTDKLDAEMISRMLLSSFYQNYFPQSYHILSLESLARLRFSMVKERTKYKAKLQNIMVLVFPEYFKFFTAPFEPTSIYFLKNFLSPRSLANANFDKITKDVFSLSK